MPRDIKSIFLLLWQQCWGFHWPFGATLQQQQQQQYDCRRGWINAQLNKMNGNGRNWINSSIFFFCIYSVGLLCPHPKELLWKLRGSIRADVTSGTYRPIVYPSHLSVAYVLLEFNDPSLAICFLLRAQNWIIFQNIHDRFMSECCKRVISCCCVHQGNQWRGSCRWLIVSILFVSFSSPHISLSLYLCLAIPSSSSWVVEAAAAAASSIRLDSF